MKIIISHDVDHIVGWRHWYRDFHWEKWIIKNILFFLSYLVWKMTGYSFVVSREGVSFKKTAAPRGVRFSWFMKRIAYVFVRKMEDSEVLMKFDRKYGVPSTFFVGMDRVLGMSYSLSDAIPFIKKITDNGFDVGVHGVAFDNQVGVTKEYQRFQKIVTGQGWKDSERFGIRNHYLRGRGSLETHQFQADAGYVFDSTDYGLKPPYKVGKMWEFPLSLMDAYILEDYENDLDSVKAKTLEELEKAKELNLPYFLILFHNPFPVWPDKNEWYYWLVEYLCKNKYEFISFKDAVKELESAK